MQNDTQKQIITGMVESLLESDPEYFLVDVRITLGNNVRVFIDGDGGVSIDKCVSVNRALYKQFEEAAVFPNNDFSLEVSSPGLDEPLRLQRQYKKNINRFVELALNDGTQAEGKLVAVNEQGIEVEETRGKKKEVVKHTFPFDNIKTTKIKVVF